MGHPVGGIGGIHTHGVRREPTADGVAALQLFRPGQRALEGIGLDDDVGEVREDLLLITRLPAVDLCHGRQGREREPPAAINEILLVAEVPG